MREGVSKHLALLAVELYEISEQYIYDVRHEQNNPERVFNILPEYTINHNKGANNSPISARYYHQFIGLLEPKVNENDKYKYFRLATQDNLLNEEINNGGIEDLFKGFDFEKYLSKFKPLTEESLKRYTLPPVNYLIIELTYTTTIDYYSGGYECDMEVDIVGYLDNNLQRMPFDKDVSTETSPKYKKGDEVKLPLGEKGVVVKYYDLLWGSRYDVKITESNGFNNVDEIVDFFEKDLK